MEEPKPLRVAVGCAQVSVALGPAIAVGGLMFWITLTVAVLVQPLKSVTMTECVPGVVNWAWLVV